MVRAEGASGAFPAKWARKDLKGRKTAQPEEGGDKRMDCRLAARRDGASTGGSEKQKDKAGIDSIYRIVATCENNSISRAVR